MGTMEYEKRCRKEDERRWRGEVKLKIKNDTSPDNVMDRCSSESRVLSSLRSPFECRLCGKFFDKFSELLGHITMKHFKPEVNKMITTRFPGFWASENARTEQTCTDCGEVMVGRATLQRHLGVEHNMMWDNYVQRVKEVA